MNFFTILSQWSEWQKTGRKFWIFSILWWCEDPKCLNLVRSGNKMSELGAVCKQNVWTRCGLETKCLNLVQFGIKMSELGAVRKQNGPWRTSYMYLLCMSGRAFAVWRKPAIISGLIRVSLRGGRPHPAQAAMDRKWGNWSSFCMFRCWSSQGQSPSRVFVGLGMPPETLENLHAKECILVHSKFQTPSSCVQVLNVE